MKPLTCFMSALALLAAPALVHADAKSDAAALAKAIAPFVEAETILVASLDLTRLDPEISLDLAARILPMSPDTLDWAKKETMKEMKTAIQIRVKEIHVVVAPGNVGLMPRAWGIIPMLPNTDEKAIRATFDAPATYGRFVQGSFVVPFPPCFSSSAESQSPDFRPAARPELAEALEAAGDSAIKVVIIPPAYTQRVIGELLPEFPKELGGGPTTILTRGMSWAALGIDIQPNLRARLTIQSADAQAAEALHAKLAEILRLIGGMKEVRKAAPKFDEVAALLAFKMEGSRLQLVLDEKNQGVEKFLSLVAPPIEAAKTNSLKYQNINNLKMLGLAMHNYANAKKHFPLPADLSKDGKPLLSWRVTILPYLGYEALFKQFHLDESWDSPHNRTLIDKMPSVYRMPVSKLEKGRTNYLLPVGGGAVFEADKPTIFQDISDGTSNTIMVVEVDDAHSVIWTKPEDLPFDPKDPAKGLGSFVEGSSCATMCDGSVRWFLLPKEPKDVERLRALFTRAGKEPIGWSE